MPSIGSQSFIGLRGAVQPFGERLEEITRAGVDGVAFRKMGKRSRPYQLVSVVDVADASAAEAEVAACKALQGTLQTVTEDNSNATEEVAVLLVDVAAVQPIATPSGGVVDGDNGTFLVRLVWTLQNTKVPSEEF